MEFYKNIMLMIAKMQQIQSFILLSPNKLVLQAIYIINLFMIKLKILFTL